MILTKKQYTTFLFILFGIVLFTSYEDTSFAQDTFDTQVTVPESASPLVIAPQVSKGKFEYIEITESCGPDFEGHCISAYAGPGVEYKKVYQLRNGMVLKIKSKIEKNGQVWYRVYFDEWLRHPDRVEGDWYIPAVAGDIVTDDGEKTIATSTSATNKRIVIDLSDHMIYAYDGTREFLATKVSTGVSHTPTPTGTFTIYKKTPSRYMQGPIEGVTDTPFDLAGVPWDMYFTQDGAVIHGSYWHSRYGTEQSNGCINLPVELAKILYDWADMGTTVMVQE